MASKIYSFQIPAEPRQLASGSSAHRNLAILAASIEARYPEAMLRREKGLPWQTGISAIDDSIAGGLPMGGTTEVVAPSPGGGTSSVVRQLIARASDEQKYCALIDNADSFSLAPNDDDSAFENLLWVRPPNMLKSLQVADALLRDDSFSIVLMDLRSYQKNNQEKPHQPYNPSVWYRFKRLLARSEQMLIVVSNTPSIPNVDLRLQCGASTLSLRDRFIASTALLERLELSPVKVRQPSAPESVVTHIATEKTYQPASRSEIERVLALAR